MTRIVWPTATAARLFPRRAASRRYCTPRSVSFLRAPTWAACTSSVRSQGLPWRVLPPRLIAQGAPGTFVVVRAHPCPTGLMGRTWDPAHVDADLGDECFCQVRTNPGNRVQPRHRTCARTQPL